MPVELIPGRLSVNTVLVVSTAKYGRCQWAISAFKTSLAPPFGYPIPHSWPVKGTCKSAGLGLQ